jgi:uncharacterized membrane protein
VAVLLDLGRVSLIVACIAALLFPIVSLSDDVNSDRTFNDLAATVVTSVVLFVAFIAIARLRSIPPRLSAVHVASPSDPRSPPAR